MLVGILGIIFNTVAIVTLVGHNELSRHFFNWLLTVLAVVDNIFLATSISEAIRQHFYQSSLHDYVYGAFLHPFRSMIMFASIYMIIVLSYERYKVISNPVVYQTNIDEMSNPWLSLLKYIGPLVIFSIVFYLPKFWELQVNEVVREVSVQRNEFSENNTHIKEDIILKSSTTINETSLRHNKIYVLWYVTIFNVVMTSAIPLILLAYLNAKVYYGLKYIQKSRVNLRATSTDLLERANQNVSQGIVLLSIVCVFVFCHVLRLILNISEVINHERERNAYENGCFGVEYWMFIATTLSNFLILVNSSINFFIYCLVNKTFKALFLERVYSTAGLTKRIFDCFCWYCVCRTLSFLRQSM